jgi:hypothetical protein
MRAYRDAGASGIGISIGSSLYGRGNGCGSGRCGGAPLGGGVPR